MYTFQVLALTHRMDMEREEAPVAIIHLDFKWIKNFKYSFIFRISSMHFIFFYNFMYRLYQITYKRIWNKEWTKLALSICVYANLTVVFLFKKNIEIFEQVLVLNLRSKQKVFKISTRSYFSVLVSRSNPLWNSKTCYAF